MFSSPAQLAENGSFTRRAYAATIAFPPRRILVLPTRPAWRLCGPKPDSDSSNWPLTFFFRSLLARSLFVRLSFFKTHLFPLFPALLKSFPIPPDCDYFSNLLTVAVDPGVKTGGCLRKPPSASLKECFVGGSATFLFISAENFNVASFHIFTALPPPLL